MSPAHPRRPPPDAAQIVARLSEQVVDVLARIRAAHAGLAEDPDPMGPRELALLALHQEREQLVRELSAAVVQILASGGSIRVEPPSGAGPEPGPPGEAREAPAPEPAVAEPGGTAAASDAQASAEPEDPADAQTECVEPEPGSAPPGQPRPERPPATRPPPPSPSRPPVRRPPPAKRPAPRTLAGHLQLIGRPVRITSQEEASAAIERLMEATAHVDSWLEYPQEVQRSLVGLASSIARHLQDEADVHLDAAARESLRAWFPVMTQWSKLYRPGFVPGLSRRFGPDHDSWSTDADHWWWVLMDVAEPGSSAVVEVDARTWVARQRGRSEAPPEPPTPSEALEAVERAIADPNADLAAALQLALDAGVPQRDPKLVATLLPHADRVVSLPRFKTLKAALREASGADDDKDRDDDDDGSASPPVILDDWPFLELTERKHAVIVGGDRRTQAVERIREAFRFEDVEWELKEPRRLKGLAERVRSKSVDFVIVLRAFIGHAEQETILDACRAARVPFVVVDSGYGVNQVKRAIERFCNV